MILVFKHDLRKFIEANLEIEFPTCNGRACLVHQFILSKHPEFVGTVTAKRIREHTAADGVQTLDCQPWLKEFVTEVDMIGVRGVEAGARFPIHVTGRQCLDVLNAITM